MLIEGLKILRMKSSDLEKFRYLTVLKHTNVHLFYRLLAENIKVCATSPSVRVYGKLTIFQELTPLIYTPTVGEACVNWSEIYTIPDGT